MNKENKLSVSSLALGLTAASLAQCFAAVLNERSARAFLWQNLPGTAALVLISLVFCALAERYQLISGKSLAARFTGLVLVIWFGWELVHTCIQAQAVCRIQFGTNAIIGVFPLLLLVGIRINAAALNQASRIMWWLFFITVLVFIAGLYGQMDWHRLFLAEETGNFWFEDVQHITLYPEYFVLSALFRQKDLGKATLLPIWSYAVQVSYVIAAELIFGQVSNSAYTGAELLRVWSLGWFSRLDALVLLIWLAMALYRICLIIHILRLLFRQNSPGKISWQKGEKA